MKNNYQDFCTSILLHLLLPLMPLVFEFNYTDFISERSLTMTASIYAFSIGVSSRNKVTLAICIIIGLLNAGNYGATILSEMNTESTHTAFDFTKLGAFWLIILIFIIHGIERWVRHIEENEEFALMKKRA